MGLRDFAGVSALSIRALPSTSACRGAGKRPGFTFSIVALTPEGRCSGKKKARVLTMWVVQESFLFLRPSGVVLGLPKGRRVGYKGSSRLWSYTVPTRYADRIRAHEVDSTQREGLCGWKRSLTERVDGQTCLGTGVGRPMGEKERGAHIPRWCGMGAVGSGARRATLKHTGASAQS